MQISVAWFDHMHDNMPKMVFSSWDEFVATLEVAAKVDRNAIDKPHSPSVSPALYAQGTRRGNANVQGFGGWFALDIDHAPGSLQDASDLCIKAGVNHVIWTTTNHSLTAPRFRIAFPLDRYVSANEMAQFWLGANTWFQGWGDPNTKDPSRMMIAPAHWQDTNPQFMRIDGLGTMSVDRLLALAASMPSEGVGATTLPKRPTPVSGRPAASSEQARAQSAISKLKLGTLTKADLHGVKAEHLMPPSSKAQQHGRRGSKLAAAKKTLDRLKRAAK